MSTNKSKEELQAEQEAAKQQIQQLLDTSRPKNLRHGVVSGVGNIVSGCVGMVGMVVLAPTVGASMGAKQGGIIGGTVGLVGGAVVGVVGGAAMAVGGAVQGATQMIRGVAAVPDSVMEPRRGKWWNDVEGKWILTHLDDESKSLIDVPEDDEDILREAKKDADDATKPPDELSASKVKDTSYYDALEIAPDADPSKIKRQYYLLARKYHPDKVGTEDKAAAEKFKDIAEAYQVLSDPELRKKYDVDGKEGLSPDRTGVNSIVPGVDPALLFAFLFGSDKFGDYLGRLAMATSALVGDSKKIGPVEARTLQKRRVTRLAIKLAERLEMWVKEDYDGAKAIWASAATDLSQASYGTELVRTIGKIYSLSAHQFLGSLDSGIGMPSIAKWAKGHAASMERQGETSKAKRDGLVAGMKMVTMQQTAAKDIAAATTDEERKAKMDEMEEKMTTGMLGVMWTTTVVDITTTLHEVAQMVLFDQSVDRDTRKRRGFGLKHLGEIFMAVSPSGEGVPANAKTLYEDAAFAAMLETIKRKEEASQAAHAT
mmetsp:Transcript_24908/g.52201  ORF Transcript_24908/g.52201 Transcript_24908/m.52201 type:complete len:542 (+) Transcript_24908:105-1730(+)